MSKLIITADIHGSISTWNKITALLDDGDTLAVAGDLFDTVYGNFNDSDFQPEIIKNELSDFPCDFHYVYGNCDQAKFLPGYESQKVFSFENRTLFLSHGHIHRPDLTDYDIIIEGHTHIARLNPVMGKVFLNPGSPVLPRENGPSYAVLQDNTIKIIDIDTNKTHSYLNL